MTPWSYVIAMWLVGSVPPHVSVATYATARMHGQDEVVIGAYLISEHDDDWTPDPGACSSAGACGPFQLGRTWPAEFGYSMDQRGELWASAHMAARLVEYTMDRHETKCGPDAGHEWQAHLKSRPGGRDSVAHIVRGWRGFEADLRGLGGEG